MYKGIFFIFFILIWQGSCIFFDVPAYALPSPFLIGRTLFIQRSYLMHHLCISLIEIFLGLGFGIILALVTSLIFDKQKALSELLMPYLILFKNLPIFVLAPLLLLWCGHGIGPKAFLIALSCYFPMTLGLMDGLRQSHTSFQDFLSCGKPFSWSRTLFFIRLPYALPQFLTGFRLALLHAPMSVIACDWIGASSGLGYVMMLCYGRMDLCLMFASLILLVLLSIIFYGMALILEKNLTNKLHLDHL